MKNTNDKDIKDEALEASHKMLVQWLTGELGEYEEKCGGQRVSGAMLQKVNTVLISLAALDTATDALTKARFIERNWAYKGIISFLDSLVADNSAEWMMIEAVKKTASIRKD
jgi:hypothetical protein